MKKKIIAALTLSLLTNALISHAEDNSYTSCAIEVAISSPPVTMNQYVVFNINSERGTSRSITLKGGSAPHVFSQLICSSMPYNISATLYSYPNSSALSQPIGQCVLKSGPVVLNEANNSISAVFPNDFDCGTV